MATNFSQINKSKISGVSILKQNSSSFRALLKTITGNKYIYMAHTGCSMNVAERNLSPENTEISKLAFLLTCHGRVNHPRYS